MDMSQSYEVNTFKQGIEQLHVDAIQHDKQGNIIYNEFEQKERNHEYHKDLEKEYGINFGDVVKIGGYLGRVQELYVYEGKKENQGVGIKLYGGTEFEDIRCKEVGMTTAKEFLKSIKVQPKEKEKKLSIKEKIKNTIKTKVQTLKKKR